MFVILWPSRGKRIIIRWQIICERSKESAKNASLMRF
jgi:hypothetical protein